MKCQNCNNCDVELTADKIVEILIPDGQQNDLKSEAVKRIFVCSAGCGIEVLRVIKKTGPNALNVGKLWKLFNKTRKQIENEYSFGKSEIKCLEKVELEIKHSIKYSISEGNFIKLGRDVADAKTELLLLHEWMHQAFLNAKFVNDNLQRLDQTFTKQLHKGFLNQFLDSFIDLQLKIFAKFSDEIWSDLGKPNKLPYPLVEFSLKNQFNLFVGKHDLDKNKVHLAELVKLFIKENLSKILKYGFYGANTTPLYDCDSFNQNPFLTTPF